jgi:uncharacterized membrane protein
MNVVVVFRGYVLGVVKTLIKKMCLKIIREEPGEERFNGMVGCCLFWFGCCLVWLLLGLVVLGVGCYLTGTR